MQGARKLSLKRKQSKLKGHINICSKDSKDDSYESSSSAKKLKPLSSKGRPSPQEKQILDKEKDSKTTTLERDEENSLTLSRRLFKSMVSLSLKETNGYQSLYSFIPRDKTVLESGYEPLPKTCFNCLLLRTQKPISVNWNSSIHNKQGTGHGRNKDTAIDEKDIEKSENSLSTKVDERSQTYISTIRKGKDDATAISGSSLCATFDSNYYEAYEKTEIDSEKALFNDFRGENKHDNPSKNKAQSSREHDAKDCTVLHSDGLKMKENDTHSVPDIELIDFDSDIDDITLDIPKQNHSQLMKTSCNPNLCSEKDTDIAETNSKASNKNNPGPIMSHNNSPYQKKMEEQYIAKMKYNKLFSQSYHEDSCKQMSGNKISMNHAKYSNRHEKYDNNHRLNNAIQQSICTQDYSKETNFPSFEGKPGPESKSKEALAIHASKNLEGKGRNYIDLTIDFSSTCSRKSLSREKSNNSYKSLSSSEEMHYDTLKKTSHSFDRDASMHGNCQPNLSTKKSNFFKKKETRLSEEQVLSPAECPVCQFKFPEGWGEFRRTRHVSECIPDSILIDDNDDGELFGEIN